MQSLTGGVQRASTIGSPSESDARPGAASDPAPVASPKPAVAVASGLSERIELLDAETRSCWRRVEDLEDEEASLNHRLVKLEKLRRRERLEVLGLEQACQAAEVSMLRAQEEAAEFDARACELERLAQDAAEDAAEDAESRRHATERLEGTAALISTLGELPAHEEHRRKLVSVLQEAKNQARNEIAQAARAAAELRRSAKKLDGERLPLEHETAALRKELAEMAGEEEIRARMARTKQIGDGLHRRLQHATNLLASVRDSLSQGPAKRLEEEERQSLELMQAIAEAKGRLRSRGDSPDQPRGRASSSSITRGGGGGRVFSPPRPSQPRLQLEPSRGSASAGRNTQQPGGRRTWGGGWS